MSHGYENVIVGYFYHHGDASGPMRRLEHEFVCPECNGLDPYNKSTPVYRVNIGIYSQDCRCCGKLVVEGVRRPDGTPLVLFDKRA